MSANIEFDGEAVADGLSGCLAERRLWAEVISQAYSRAMVGEQKAILFFNSAKFQTLSQLMNLPEQLIKQRVISKAGTHVGKRRARKLV